MAWQCCLCLLALNASAGNVVVQMLSCACIFLRVFPMKIMHGSITNKTNTLRFSCDIRWQPASHPVDPRCEPPRSEVSFQICTQKCSKFRSFPGHFIRWSRPELFAIAHATRSGQRSQLTSRTRGARHRDWRAVGAPRGISGQGDGIRCKQTCCLMTGE
jgi:hypothetical protein